MVLVDDLKAPTPAAELSRRKALGILTSSAFAVATAGAGVTASRFLRPSVLFEPPTTVPVGPPESIAVGTLLVLPEQRLYVVHSPPGFFAMSAVCTHLGCMTRYAAAKKAIVCPCHGSRFDEQGQVTGGPAPTPLIRKHVALRDGQIIVDTMKTADTDFILEV